MNQEIPLAAPPIEIDVDKEIRAAITHIKNATEKSTQIQLGRLKDAQEILRKSLLEK